MSSHECKFCGEAKPFTEFNKHLSEGPLEPWNLRRCKACAHRDFKQRQQDPDANRRLMLSSRAWKDRNPDRHAELAREYRKRHPEKIIAHNRLNYAIRMGRVVRLPCGVCGTTEKVHAHHVSYDPADWYNVKWLCYVCHKIEHTEPEMQHSEIPA
jgi:hypothetical protein